VRTVIKTASGLQDRLEAMVRSGTPVNGEKAMGGIQPLAAGELNFGTKSVRVCSGQEIIGQGAETRITWLGGPGDPPLFDISSFAGNGNAHAIMFANMQINAPNGGDVIGCSRTHGGAYYPVHKIEKLRLENVVIRGGRINLPKDDAELLPDDDEGKPITGEHYECIFNNVEMVDPVGQAIRLDGFRHTFIGLRINGKARGQFPLLHLHGGATFIDGRIEPYGDCPLAWFGSLTMKNGYVHRGDYRAPGGFHFEHHPSRMPVKSVHLEHSTFGGVQFGGTQDWYWELSDGAALKLTEEINAGSIRGDGKLFINGEDRTYQVDRPER